jgi:hypothetical protein
MILCLADNEKRLVKKCRELNTEIVGNAAKVQTALKLSEEDQQTIVALKKEIEKAWKMVDASHEKVRQGLSAIYSAGGLLACLQDSHWSIRQPRAVLSHFANLQHHVPNSSSRAGHGH